MLSGAAPGSVNPASPASMRLAGTWKLDASRSRVGSAAAPVGLVKTGGPQTLHITQAANGTVIVESQINESQSRAYRPGAQTATPVVPTGTITMKARWDGSTLVSEGALEAGAAPVPVPVKETFAVDAEGRLTLTTVVGVGADAATSVLVYARTKTVESCKAWPTPCK
jgi:hypothetical protein